MEYRILGPLEVVQADRPVALGGGKQRALLALLLLHANEVVPSERLIDELWGDAPPATAAKSVQVYVSQLRKALRDGHDANGRDGPLLTRSGGYVLELGAGELDLHRFEGAVEEGRRALDGAAPERAAARLRDGLSLWRGEPLQDFSYEPFAQAEIGRLEDLRLVALEARIDADLACGRHAELVGELEMLVADHPLHERLRAQLMLALYRCGRQADALEAYRDARRRLVDELGLEPSPTLQHLERAILDQDDALAAPAPAARSPAEPRSPRHAPPPASAPARPPPPGPIHERLQRHRVALIAIGAAVLTGALAVAAAQLLSGGDTSGEPRIVTPLRFNALAGVDRDDDAIRAAVPVPGRLGRLAAGAGTVWVASDDSRTVSAVDPRTRRVTRTIPAGVFPSDLAAGRDAVWVVDGRRRLLVRIQPAYGRVTGRVRLPGSPRDRAPQSDRFEFDPTSVAVGTGAVWVTDGSARVLRVDPATLARTAAIRTPGAAAGVAAEAGAVWAIASPATVLRIDERTNRITDRIRLVNRSGPDVPYPIAVAVGGGFVWVLAGNTATVTKIDPRTAGVVGTTRIGVDRGPSALAAGADATWVANADGSLSRIDAATGEMRSIPVGRGLRDVGLERDAVWVTNQLTRCCGQE